MLQELNPTSDRQIALGKVLAEIERRNNAKVSLQRVADRLEELRESCKRMHNFIKEAWHVLEPTTTFLDNWHLGVVCEHLEAVHSKQITGLLVMNLPPGTMKSWTVSVALNPWEWGPGRQPGLRYLCTAYKEDLVNRDSLRSRDLIRSPWYQALWPEVKLVKSGDTEFINSYYGRRKSIPFLSLTGDRGNRVIIDDPHSLKMAESEQERPKTVQHFRESATSRVNDPKHDVTIIMMQRMHPEDVCGVIDELELPAVKLILPMEYVRSLSVKTPWFEDPRKEEGELLHPERYPRETLEKDKIRLGPHAYDTQFQQMPRARAGSYYFSDEHFLLPNAEGVLSPVPFPSNCDTIFAVVDTASKAGKQNDGTGCWYLAFENWPKPQLYVLDWEYFQTNASTLIHWLPQVRDQLERFAVSCGARMGNIGGFIEDKDSGVVLLQQAAEQMLPFQAIPSELTALGKDGRALTVSGYIYQRQVLFTEPAYTKVIGYKGRSKNHAFDQATHFRMSMGTPNDEDEMFDCLCYSTALAFDEKYRQ